jgi:hypothetical protein
MTAELYDNSSNNSVLRIVHQFQLDMIFSDASSSFTLIIKAEILLSFFFFTIKQDIQEEV